MPTTRVNDLIAIASLLSGVSERDIRGPARFKHIVRVRQAVCHVAMNQGVHSSVAIGVQLGDRDHSTILHAHRIVPGLMQVLPDYAALVTSIQETARKSVPFLGLEKAKVEYITPVAKSPQLRPMFACPPDDQDSGKKFHDSMAQGSTRLLAALQAA